MAQAFPSLQSPIVNLQTGIVTQAWYRLLLRILAQTGPGWIGVYGGASAPDGTLPCDGAAVSRTTYASLFAVVGTTFGIGDGSTTFNVPNIADPVAGAFYVIYF